MIEISAATPLKIVLTTVGGLGAEPTSIAAPGLVILDADPPVGMAAALDALPFDNLPHFRIEGPVKLVANRLIQLSGTPGLIAPLAWVMVDVAAQAQRFADITGTMHIGLKLERITDNACRKLHHDYVAHRLVCTYRGPGTEWLPHQHEQALGDERETVPPEWLEPVPRFAAALFAGRVLPGARPVLHRSPPIAGTGEVRLVLTINEPFSGRH
jgi:hypothetical protein